MTYLGSPAFTTHNTLIILSESSLSISTNAGGWEISVPFYVNVFIFNLDLLKKRFVYFYMYGFFACLRVPQTCKPTKVGFESPGTRVKDSFS